MNAEFLCSISLQRYRLPTITGIVIPQGVDWKKISSFIAEKYVNQSLCVCIVWNCSKNDLLFYLCFRYQLDISGGLGGSAGKVRVLKSSSP